jgi:hypothetical protein
VDGSLKAEKFKLCASSGEPSKTCKGQKGLWDNAQKKPLVTFNFIFFEAVCNLFFEKRTRIIKCTKKD